MSYLPHRAFISPALPTADLPRLIIGVVAIELIYGLCLDVIAIGLTALPTDLSNSYYYGTTPAGLLAQLLSFGFLAGAIAFVARFLNRRTFRSLIGAIGPAVHQFRVTLVVCLTLFAAIELLPPYWSTAGAEPRSPVLWLMLLPLSFVALTVQTAAEELLYRGYVQQQLAARFNTPWIWLTLPNLLFATAHWDSTAAMSDAVQYMVWAFCFGLAASDLTARTGTLGAAVGFHLANNLYAFLFFGEAGSPDSGLALLLFPPEEPLLIPIAGDAPILSLSLLVELSIVALMWLVARVALRR
ncbi:CPBP family intramembrane glutamic endopeptidase [Thalassovita taeanensis]|uniref:CAAX prenyl protease 2/Lysostaphin resistance protein A-like domain-containing protein n=1 Tax=Thalassovita taeanensis TaxID=657014 RepID=A0A1H9DPW7_9RHOB|nr:CPBP family intramembrane glutamic endopeptidase [Thalassovita taeanensis]SEQ15545.1 hypothetical protein SAMN04488092_104240 [Thalassovita taeanensis]